MQAIQRRVGPAMAFRGLPHRQSLLHPRFNMRMAAHPLSCFPMLTQAAMFSSRATKWEQEPGEMTLQQRLQAAYELIKRVQRTDPIRYMCNDCVPLDLEGTMELPIIPERKYVTQYLDDKQVDRDVLQTHLFSMLQDFFEALQKEDYDAISRFSEARFVDRLKLNR